MPVRGLLAAATAAALLVPLTTASADTLPSVRSAATTAAAARSANAAAETGSPFSPALADRLTRTIQEAMRTYGIPGAVVGLWQRGVHGHQYVRAFGVRDLKTGAPMRADINTRIGSITKTFTVTAVLELVDQGLLKLDDPISEYIQGVPGGNKITLRELADMRSGLYPYTADIGFLREFETHPTRSFTPQQLLAYGFKHPNLFAPNAAYLYSNSNTVLLGLVVEKLTHTSLEQYVWQHVIEPSGLCGSFMSPTTYLPRPHAHGYTVQTPHGTVADATGWSTSWAWADGDMISNLRDLHAWAYDLYQGNLLSPHTQAQRLTFVPTGTAGFGYGLGVAEVNGWIGHNGEVPGYETLDIYLPSQQLTLTLMINTDIPYQGNVANLPVNLLGQAITQLITPHNVFGV